MIDHAQKSGGEGEPVVGRAELEIPHGFFMRVMRDDNRPLEQFVRRHVVRQLQRQIDHLLTHLSLPDLSSIFLFPGLAKQ